MSNGSLDHAFAVGAFSARSTALTGKVVDASE
jgi:hypothetical protein